MVSYCVDNLKFLQLNFYNNFNLALYLCDLCEILFIRTCRTRKYYLTRLYL